MKYIIAVATVVLSFSSFAAPNVKMCAVQAKEQCKDVKELSEKRECTEWYMDDCLQSNAVIKPFTLDPVNSCREKCNSELLEVNREMCLEECYMTI